jgi:hypothetical protein
MMFWWNRLPLMISSSATAAIVWDESIDGDLSNNPSAPTSLAFASGANDVLGSAGLPDQDFITFVVPAGFQLRAIVPVTIDFSSGDLDEFIAIESGTAITAVTTPPFATAAGLLGWQHVGAGEIGTNILPAMGASGDGASGFVGPLGPGAYAVWIQDDKPSSYDYRFVIGTPEPSTWVLSLLGFASLAAAGLRASRMVVPRSAAPAGRTQRQPPSQARRVRFGAAGSKRTRDREKPRAAMARFARSVSTGRSHLFSLSVLAPSFFEKPA